MLREFRAVQEAGPRLTILPTTIKQSPFAQFFCCASQEVTPSMLDAFRLSVAASVKSLISGSGLLDFHHEIDPRFDTGQGIPFPEKESDINRNFATPGASHDALVRAIQTELTALGSTLIPEVVVGRIQALSCAGCHRLSSRAQNPEAPDLRLKDKQNNRQKWPSSIEFEHVSEVNPEQLGDGLRYRVSEAVIAFLPRRKEALCHVLGPACERP